MATRILAVGGGKGGTGKSFLSSALAVTLARKGMKTVLLDADWGGANLHSFLGVKPPKLSLTDFFEKGMPLEDLRIGTEIPSLSFVAGHFNSFNPAVIKYTQKLKFFRHLRLFNVDYVVVDLGAGTDPNTMDTFLQADIPVVVTVPEVTSIDNLYLFVKKGLFRRIKAALSEIKMEGETLEQWEKKKSEGFRNLGEMVSFLKGLDPAMAAVLERVQRGFSLFLVLNQVRSPEQVEMGLSLKSVFSKYFGVKVSFSGYISYRDYFWRLLNERCSLSSALKESSLFPEMNVLLDNLIGPEREQGVNIHG